MAKDAILEVNNPPATQPTRWQILLPHLRVFAFYTVLTLLVVWPVVIHLPTLESMDGLSLR